MSKQTTVRLGEWIQVRFGCGAIDGWVEALFETGYENDLMLVMLRVPYENAWTVMWLRLDVGEAVDAFGQLAWRSNYNAAAEEFRRLKSEHVSYEEAAAYKWA